MRNTLLLAAMVSAFGMASNAMAQAAAPAAPASPHTFTGNFTLASEYLYRGIAQTRGKAALQGGFDYSHSSGLYAGVWASNISWIGDAVAGASAPIEIDVYGGYKGTITGDLGFDVGVLTYNYPGTGKPTGAAKPETTEIYGALSWKWLSLKYSHTTGSLFGFTKSPTFTEKTKGSGYLDLSASYDLGNGWGVNGHIGHQKVKGYSDASYSDYKIGVTKDVGFGTVGLSYLTTNAKDNCSTATSTPVFAADAANPYCFVNNNGTNAYDAGKGRALLSFTKTF